MARPAPALAVGWGGAAPAPAGALLRNAAVRAPPARPVPPPAYTFTPGDRFATTTIVRLRRTPGIADSPPDDIIAEIMPGVEGGVLAGPEDRDGLVWWQVRIADATGRLLTGWMAERTGAGEVLMVMVHDTDTPPDTFRIGDLAQMTDFVNVRRTPGVVNKAGDDVLGALLPKSAVVILEGSRQVDGLNWWRIGGILVPGGEVRGWGAEATPAAGGRPGL